MVLDKNTYLSHSQSLYIHGNIIIVDIVGVDKITLDTIITVKIH